MDIIISILAAECIPIWMLRMTMKATRLRGGARLTTALSALGLGGGMFGGIVTLLFIQIISLFLTQALLRRLYTRVLQQLRTEGYSLDDMMKTISNSPVSRPLKERLKRIMAP